MDSSTCKVNDPFVRLPKKTPILGPQPSCSSRHYLCRGWATGTLGGTVAETVAELARDELERAHASGTGGLSPLGLLTPVVCRVLSE